MFEETHSESHELVCLHTYVYMYMYTYILVHVHILMHAKLCNIQDVHLWFIFVLHFPFQVLGMGGRDTKNYLVKLVHPALSTSYPPSSRGGDWCYALWTCSPYASICNGTVCAMRWKFQNNFLGYHPCPPKRKTEWDRFASEAVVLHYLILSLRWCMLFSTLCVGCARDARVVTHACVFIHDVSYVSSRQYVCYATMRCRDKVIL